MNYSANLERATGIEPVLPAWELKFSLLYFHNLQNRSAKINAHATHTVHAVQDLRLAAGRLRDGLATSLALSPACSARIDQFLDWSSNSSDSLKIITAEFDRQELQAIIVHP